MDVETASSIEGSKRFARLVHILSIKLDLLDFVIALGRKIAGFCGLLTLGWTYLRLLALGDTTRTLYPDAADPDLRQTLWVAVLLVMAQGWDIPTDRIAGYWERLQGRLPSRIGAAAMVPRLPRAIEPLVIRLGRFMDLCVAIANKLGAFAVFVYLLVLANKVWLGGSSLRQLYPDARDPSVSMLADLCVYLVVLGWWATPFAQIAFFWTRLRDPVGTVSQASRRVPGS